MLVVKPRKCENCPLSDACSKSGKKDEKNLQEFQEVSPASEELG